MNLAHALRLRESTIPPVCLALVGAGGKTTALFQLARQLASPTPAAGNGQQLPVLVTTTTHLKTSQLAFADRLLSIKNPADIAAIAAIEAQLSPGVNLVIGEEATPHRVSGPGPVSLEQLWNLARSRRLPLLIEADGSRQRPLKAPGAHEPAIPGFVDMVVVVAGLSGLGKPLMETWVHRPERFAALSGLESGGAITPEALESVLCDAQGGLKGIPSQARRVVLLNQADTPGLRAQAQEMAPHLLGKYLAVLVAALSHNQVFAVHEPVAGIVLAAGEARRFGSPKQLLMWKGQPFIRQVARAALDGGLLPVMVITGAHAAEVEAALEGLPVTAVRNPSWQQGQSASLQAGLRALPPDVKAAVFLLADQPQVPPALIRRLVDAHAASCNALAAPRSGGRRANPVLFDTVTFPALLALSGDAGGRSLFSDPTRFPVDWVDWEDEGILLDVDTREDYEKLVGRGEQEDLERGDRDR